MISQDNKAALRNPWVWAVIGLIVVVLAVNITFVLYSANSSRSTLVEQDYKTKDRKANEELLEELREQQSLAWQTTIKKPKALVMNTPTSYEISVVDRDGKPVSGVMEVEAYRASDASKDFSTAFKEVAPGSYQGFINFPLKGYWELRIHLKRGEDEFRVNTDRFMVDEKAQ
ncbi:MAG: FixH family protein [Gallionella sp.]|nr:FixH family protein [Gallionella sp.]